MQMPELMGNKHILLPDPHTLLVHIILQKTHLVQSQKSLLSFCVIRHLKFKT